MMNKLLKKGSILFALMTFLAMTHSMNAQYCEATSTSVEPITRVIFAGIDNASTGMDGYEDFTAIVAEVEAGETYSFTAEGDTGGNYTNFFTVWIDWDNNGVFEEDEKYDIGSIQNSDGTDGQQATNDIAVPADAVSGEIRMRVRKKYNAPADDPCGSYSFGQTEDYTVNVGDGGSTGGEDCGQGDDSNGFEIGFNITSGVDFRNADDFMVSPDNTLNIKSIELNLLAGAPVSSIDFNFYNDEDGAPGSTVVESLSGVVPYAQVMIGAAFEYNVYAVFVEVDVNFEGGASGKTYWMQPTTDGSAFWEVSTVGTLGAPIHTSELEGAWVPDEDGSQAVFKLHCDVATPPDAECIFDITGSVEPITRVIMANVDNVSSPTSTVALEDFTDKVIIAEAGGTYAVALEGNTSGSYTNYFTIFINTGPDDDWSTFETFEIGSITGSTGTDGQQATASITLPASISEGEHILRVVKNFDSSPLSPCSTYSFGQGEDYTLNIEESSGGEDCGQGDDSNGFENGLNIIAGGTFRNADDFMVSSDNTLNIKSIELNVISDAPITSVDLNFYNDDNGAPGSTVVQSVNEVVPYAQVMIGTAFGYNVYAVFVEVDMNFEGGSSGETFWMQPAAQVNTGQAAFWEVSSVGTLGAPIHTSEEQGAWTPDEDGSQAVFKLHCDVATPPGEECLFDITTSVEPITRLIIADVDNSSSVDSTEALEDFTDTVITVQSGASYDVALEGFTDGGFTNYFTIFLNTSPDNDWSAYETFEIGSINGSTGGDGQQATSTITIPADLADGDYLLRVVKNFNSSPLSPCSSYSYGQGEDYTLTVDGIVGTDDYAISGFTYYPNPVEEVLYITAKNDIESVSAFNVLGQQVLSNKHFADGKVDVSSLSTGTFMFRVTFEGGQVENFKVVKK